MSQKYVDPGLIELRRNQEHEGTWDLLVHGKLCMVAESFAVVDGVRDSLLGRTALTELDEVARSIEGEK